jgi:hypothetical protein
MVKLPVAVVHVGCVTELNVGWDGVNGCVLITTLAEPTDVQPVALVTVKLYVPGVNPLMVVLAPEPETLPGLIVQLPDGKPLSVTLPVAVVQVGCVIVPTVGCNGVDGWAFTVTLADAAEVHDPRVAVTIYVPAGAVTVAPDCVTPADGVTV